MGDRNAAGLGGRIILVLLTLYALAMIAPDVLRVARPLGSFGMSADGDGLVYDVQGPFAIRRGIRRPGGLACVAAIGSILPPCAAFRSTPMSARACCRCGPG